MTCKITLKVNRLAIIQSAGMNSWSFGMHFNGHMRLAALVLGIVGASAALAPTRSRPLAVLGRLARRHPPASTRR